jgi:hypothetical protein
MEGRSLVTIYVPDKLKIKEYQRKQELEKKRQEEGAATTENATN